MAENKLFRKTALETVSNPEQLDQHIRVTRPFFLGNFSCDYKFLLLVLGYGLLLEIYLVVQILTELFLHQMAYQLQMLLALVSLVMF